jgi:hypothetical protein
LKYRNESKKFLLNINMRGRFIEFEILITTIQVAMLSFPLKVELKREVNGS